MNETTQRCPRCKAHLPPDAYAPASRQRAGAYCRRCRADYQRNYQRNYNAGVTLRGTRPLVLAAGAYPRPIDRQQQHTPALPPAQREACLPATYAGAHKRVRRLRGPAQAQTCEHCGGRADHWAYDHADPAPLRAPLDPPYRMTVVEFSARAEHYMALCRSCHAKFDARPLPPAPPVQVPPHPVVRRGRAVIQREPIGETKRCPMCGEVKDCAEFTPDRSKAGGYASKCRPCDRLRSKRYYDRNLDTARAARHARVRKASGKQSVRRTADRAVAVAVYGGACVDCGTDSALQFDHIDGNGGAHREVESPTAMLRRIAETGERLDYVRLELRCSPCHSRKSGETRTRRLRALEAS